ncbi:MAG: PolC-type DNA polymerase III, partial [Bradymonadaceae bacterium]
GVVVGHNIGFDFDFLAYELARRDRRGFTTRYLDTLVLARRLAPDISDYKLDSLVEHIPFDPDGQLHTAATDVRVTEALLWHLVETGDLETLADAGLSQLDWTAV